MSGSKGRKEKRHLDELLDEGLKGTFPASDPVSVGQFTGSEAPRRPIDRDVVDLTTGQEAEAGATSDAGPAIPVIDLRAGCGEYLMLRKRKSQNARASW
jgi:hypothetical protein